MASPVSINVPAAPRSTFVTFVAWISLLAGVLGTASGVMQIFMLLVFSPADALQQLFDQLRIPMALSPSLEWTLTHLGLLNFLSTLLSAALTWVSWGLLKRFEWGRLGFIAFLILSVALIFAATELSLQVLDWLARLFDDAELVRFEHRMRYLLYACAALLAGVHGWIIVKLCARPIRAEFGHGGELHRH